MNPKYIKYRLMRVWIAVVAFFAPVTNRAKRLAGGLLMQNGSVRYVRFVKNERGFSPVIAAVLSVVIAAILIIVSALIISNVADSLPTVTGAANTTITNTITGAYNALNLLQIVLIVLAAGAIISAIVVGFMYMRTRNQ